MAIVVTGPNNYVGIKANKIHLPPLPPSGKTWMKAVWRKGDGPMKGGRVKNKTRPK